MVHKLKEGWSLEVNLGNLLVLATLLVHLAVMLATNASQQGAYAGRLEQLHNQVADLQSQIKTYSETQNRNTVNIAVLQTMVARLDRSQLSPTNP